MIKNDSKLISNRIDLKATTLSAFDFTLQAINSGDLPGITVPRPLRMLIVTNFGTIEADIAEITTDVDELSSETVMQYLIAQTARLRNKEIAEYEQENENVRLTSDSSFVLLKDAEIRTFANRQAPYHISTMILFTDQIVGLSAVNN